MTWLSVIKARLAALFRTRRLETELDEELRLHLELLVEENQRRGMSPAEARREAGRRFGGLEQTKEAYRERRGLPVLEALAQDTRHGLRMMRKSPGFTAVVVLTLALGIGANTAVFQMLDAVRLRSLPVPSPQELVEVQIAGGNGGMGINPGPYGGLSRPLWREIQARQQAFSGVFAWKAAGSRVGAGSALRPFRRISVSGDFFRVLGVQPWQGRLLLPEDEARACPAATVVVSHAFWQAQMGGRPLDNHSRLTVDGEPVQVVGVTPPGFFGVAVGDGFDLALPLCQPPQLRRNLFDVSVMGRLRPGWTMERAAAHLAALSPGVFAATELSDYSRETLEKYRRFKLAPVPASTGVSQLRSSYDDSLWILLAITGLVLLIACANLANLMLARSTARDREMAVRLALGAGRPRLFQQLLVENLLLAGLGAALGIGLAHLLSDVLVASLSTESAQVDLRIETNWRVLGFTTALAVLTCAIFGVAPALRAARGQPATVMRVSGPGLTAGRGRLALQRLIVVIQISVSLVLLFGALLFTASFRKLMTFDPGIRQRGITVALLGFERSNVAPERQADFQQELLEEMRALPGVLSAATTTNLPLMGGSWGHGIRIGQAKGSSRFAWVSPGYFQTLGIRLVAGRDFDRRDTAASRRVAVVNQRFVDDYLGGANPLGQTLLTSPEPSYPATVYEIVGVIQDTKYSGLRGPTPPMTFAPASQYPAQGPGAAYMIHAEMPPAVVIEALRRRFAEKHPEIAVMFIDYQKRIREGLVREQLMAMLSGFFGLLAAALATLGLYGLISYMVVRRRKEIGIRVALGASGAHVVGLVAREAGRLLAIGLAVGTALSLVAGRTAGSLLFGLSPDDPFTLAAAAALIALIAAGASTIPAHRAARVSPMLALRED
jgi:predicted permease